MISEQEIIKEWHELAMKKSSNNVTFEDGVRWAEKQVINKACKLMATELKQIEELFDCDLGKWHRVAEFRKVLEEGE